MLSTSKDNISTDMLAYYVQEIEGAHNLNVRVAIMIGGGNICRGAGRADRIVGDQMGMLGTVINGLALQGALQQKGVPSCLFTSMLIGGIGIHYTPQVAKECYERCEVVILTGGLGQPYFSTDSAAVLRALEMQADVVLKGTKVDGVYTKDPIRNPDAKKIDALTFSEAHAGQYMVMDPMAFALCIEHQFPMIIFNFNKPGQLGQILRGELLGTRVGSA